MESKKLTSGKLRLITYDPEKRLLHVELENATALDYTSVDLDTWRRFSTSGVPWSFYRDNIEEEFPSSRGTMTPRGRPAGLDALFGGASVDEPKTVPKALQDLFKQDDNKG
jgi:hypothetical protein